jgi:hypothetical protein
LRPTVSRPVCLGVRHPSGTGDQFFPSFFSIDNCGLLDVGHPLWREDGYVIYSYNSLWSLPEQSHSGPGPAELMTIFYCLIVRLSQLWGPGPRIYIPQEQGDPVILQSTGFPFCRLLRLARLTNWLNIYITALLGPSGPLLQRILTLLTNLLQSQSQSYLTADGQSASLSCCQATIRARD